MTVRDGPDEESGRAAVGDGGQLSVGGEDVPHVDHADTECAVSAMENERAVQIVPGNPFRFDMGTDGGRHCPLPGSTRRWAALWFDAVDRTHPLGEAHVVGMAVG